MSRLSLAVRVWISVAALQGATLAGPVFLGSWGGYGSGPGQFAQPKGMAIDSDGNVYVADSDNHRIQKFDAVGLYLDEWGNFGTIPGRFQYPVDLAIDGDGNIYVADLLNYRIQKFDSAGNYLTHWGQQGSGNGQFNSLSSVAAGPTGNVFTLENHRVQEFDSSGTYLSQWGSLGTGDGQFSGPRGISVDADGNVYVADNNNYRIQKFDAVGTYLSQWADMTYPQWSPVDVATAATGHVYGVDYYAVFKFDSSLSPLDVWGRENDQRSVFLDPAGIAVAPTGVVYFSRGSAYIDRWLDVDAMMNEETLAVSDLTVWSDPDLGNELTLVPGVAIDVSDTTTVQFGASLTIDGGILTTGTLIRQGQVVFNSGDLSITGSDGLVIGFGGQLESAEISGSSSIFVQGMTTLTQTGVLTIADGAFGSGILRLDGGDVTATTLAGVPELQVAAGTVTLSANVSPVAVSGGPAGQIVADGNFSLGDASRFDGFAFGGSLLVGTRNVTLHSAGFVSLGIETTIVGGSISAANGIAIGTGHNLVGHGSVMAKVAAGLGSTIEATGDLSLGDAAALTGFTSDGELRVHEHTVTLLDANQAVLGSLTTLGEGSMPGLLQAPNGLVIEFGKSLIGFGTVASTDSSTTPLLNNGAIEGDSVANPLTLTGYVKGVGTFDNVVITGTFSPGLSPHRLTLGNIVFDPGAELEMEIGGLTRGEEYDALDLTGGGQLAGTLRVSLISDFQPQLGDTFDLFDGSFTGAFDDLNLAVLPSGLAWNVDQLFTLGVVSIGAAPLDLLGDMDFDEDIDFDDIDDFVLGLTNEGDYEDLYGVPPELHGDIDGDGTHDFDDIEGFVQLLLGGDAGLAIATVPEPASVSLVGWGLLLLAGSHRRMRRTRSASTVL